MTLTAAPTVVRAWWFSAERQLPNGDGRRVRVGRTQVHKGTLELCRSGLHASERIIDALDYAPGPLLWRVECSGEIIHGNDKIVCSRRTPLAVIDADDILRQFARWCALQVIDKWDAPGVVRRFLTSGDEALRAAARAAARAASWDAARDAQNTRLTLLATAALEAAGQDEPEGKT